MKLSEAIRLGALAIPQTRGNYRGCAFGAATYAVGRNWHYCATVKQVVGDVVNELWPWVSKLTVQCPEDMDEIKTARVVILLLNDTYGWTRERIADWVAAIEPQEVEIVEPVQLEQEVLS